MLSNCLLKSIFTHYRLRQTCSSVEKSPADTLGEDREVKSRSNYTDKKF